MSSSSSSRPDGGTPLRAALPWAILIGLIGWAGVVAASSPLLAWRGPVYVLAGFAGVAALALLLAQPLLATGRLAGLRGRRGRIAHRVVGLGLVGLVLIHVGGLWITSPPDVIDALTFTSPTPFSAWGVVAMWALFAAAVVGVSRRRLRYRTWRGAHLALTSVVIGGTVVHALLIEGTMGWTSKLALCAAVGAAAVVAIVPNRGRS